MIGALEAFAAKALDWPLVRAEFARFASSSLGRRTLEELEPREVGEARSALERVGELVTLRKRQEGPPLGGLTDPVPLLSEVRRWSRSFEAEELGQMLTFLEAGQRLTAWLDERRGALPETVRLAEAMPALQPLLEKLDRSLDPKGGLRDEATPLLAKLRAAIDKARREIERRILELAASPQLRPALADGHIGRVHLRGGRPVLAVKAKSRGRVRGIVHDQSQSGETVFVEPESVVEAGNRLATKRAEETREISRILAELTRDVLAREESLAAAARLLGELELADMSAQFCAAYAARPARTPAPGEKESMLLRSVRHPLLVVQAVEGQIQEAVPIDVRLGDDFDLLVITGPNTGGKTLALKSVGLAALLTRLGLPVPAEEGTTVPMYEGIVADIGDEQEIRQNLSTFSSHLVRIRDGLARAGPRTLVLLDELGGGTDPEEGGAFGGALLGELLALGAPTLASTHIGKLKEFAFRHARAENACVEFDSQSLQPRFRLLIGTPGESRALTIARRTGLPEKLIAHAEALMDRGATDAELLMQDLRGSREESERVRRKAEGRLHELEQQLVASETEREAIAEKKELLEREAQRGMEERLRRARPIIQRLRAVVDQLGAAQSATVATALDELESELQGATLSETRAAFFQSLSKGQMVYLPRYKRRCAVVRTDKKREQLTVMLGKQKLVIGFDEITSYDLL